MKPNKGQELELEIRDLVFGGRGIAETDGYKLFVPNVVPGDKILARVGKRKKNWGEASVLKVLEPSEKRIDARCKHFDTCGGCKWQFMTYEDQIQVKEQQVKDAIERLAELPSDLVQSAVACDEAWYYRNKMEVSFGPGDMLGFYPPGYHYEVFDLEECFLQSEEMPEYVKQVRDWAKLKGLKHYDLKRGEGVLKNLILREGKNTGERMLILVTAPGFKDADSFAHLFKNDEAVTSLYWMEVIQQKGRRTEVKEHHLAGKTVLTEALNLENGDRLEFDILPQAFFQTNTKQAEVLYSMVVKEAGLTGKEVLFDLYCGTGTIGLFCAHAAAKVIGVEINESSVNNAKNNAKKNGIENAEFHLGSVDKVLLEREERPDVIIVDPPRSGLGEKVVSQVVGFGAKRVVYVSCNPTTLARDLKQFDELGYLCEKITPVDMFPHTHHVESVATLVVKG